MKFINKNEKDFFINSKLNKKHITFFFLNESFFFITDATFKNHSKFQNWIFLCSRIYGFNKNIVSQLLPYVGCNKNILFTNVDEIFFIFFKHFLRQFSDFFSLSWYLTYLKQRTFLLPLLFKGMRYIKKLPCRGQRTRSNYNISHKRKNIINYFSFKKKLNNIFISKYYPG